jgi:hypothetical protein
VSTTVAVRPTRGRRALDIEFTEVERWVAQLAERHGLDCAGYAPGGKPDGPAPASSAEWILSSDALQLQVLVTTGATEVREIAVAPQLGLYDGPSEAPSQLWRAVLADLLALARAVGGALRSEDDDLAIQEADLDDLSQLSPPRDGQVANGLPGEPTHLWSLTVSAISPARPLAAAVLPASEREPLAVDPDTVQGWLEAVAGPWRGHVSATSASSWRLTFWDFFTIDTELETDAKGARHGLRQTYLFAYDNLEDELGARMLCRRWLWELDRLARRVGGVLHLGPGLRAAGGPDDLDEFSGLTAIARVPLRATLPPGTFLGIDFPSLSKDEAQRLMDQWLADEPRQLAWLAEQVGSEVELDRSPESLVGLWRWARQRLRWRPRGEAFDPARLPMWAHVPAATDYDDFSNDTLWLLDAVGRYWTVVWREQTHDRWILLRSKIRGHQHQNRPILERYGYPHVGNTVIAEWSLRGDPRASDRDLLDTLEGGYEHLKYRW